MAEATVSTRGILEPDAGRSHFKLIRRPPAEDLTSQVERHWIVRWDIRGEPFTQEILPHPCVNLVSAGGVIAVYGIPLGRSSRRLEGAGMAVGTKFCPGGFAAFFDAPVSDLNGRAATLPEVFGDAGAQLEHTLAACAGDPDAHVEAVEAFLRERLPGFDRRLLLVRGAVNDMLAAPAETTVAELARRHAVSERTLQRLFRRYVGVGPKWVLKRCRIHEAAERIAAGETDAGASLAFELGYFDQSHFVRDFTEQIGRSPGVYARACAAARRAAEPA